MRTILNISDEYLYNWFDLDNKQRKDYMMDKDMFSHAIQPYTCREEYDRDRELMNKYSSAGNPQDKYLLIMAAKVERTDREVLGTAVTNQ